MKILITSGATREPIDEVRFISNFSTGSTGAFLADYLSEQGHDVTLLSGIGAQSPRYAKKVITYSSFHDLDHRLMNALGSDLFDGVIHLAAVSDYSVDKIELGSETLSPSQTKKIDSSGDITLKLKKNFKIVSRLKGYSPARAPVIVAFKLTNSGSYDTQIKAIEKLSQDPGVDFVVHNDFHDIKSNKDNRYRIFQGTKVLFESLSRVNLAVELEQLIGSKR